MLARVNNGGEYGLVKIIPNTNYWRFVSDRLPTAFVPKNKIVLVLSGLLWQRYWEDPHSDVYVCLSDEKYVAINIDCLRIC